MREIFRGVAFFGFFVTLLCGPLASVGNAVAITNGSFNDLNGAADAPNPTLVHSGGTEMPQGWLNLAISPDWAAPGFDTPFAPTMTTSPDGGNWIMGYSDVSVAESVGVAISVTGFTIGLTYELSFYQAHNSSNSSFGAAGAWDVSMFGTTQSSPLLVDVGDNQVWSLATLQFGATAETSNLVFNVGTADTGISLDGVSINEVSAPIPEPSATLLFATGLAMVAGAVRRRTRVR